MDTRFTWSVILDATVNGHLIHCKKLFGTWNSRRLDCCAWKSRRCFPSCFCEPSGRCWDLRKLWGEGLQPALRCSKKRHHCDQQETHPYHDQYAGRESACNNLQVHKIASVKLENKLTFWDRIGGVCETIGIPKSSQRKLLMSTVEPMAQRVEALSTPPHYGNWLIRLPTKERTLYEQQRAIEKTTNSRPESLGEAIAVMPDLMISNKEKWDS